MMLMQYVKVANIRSMFMRGSKGGKGWESGVQTPPPPVINLNFLNLHI